ncbi:MAG: CDP-alcohol phosphatidyltransferase family protein, partial [Acidobacteriaceae bacterium]
ILMPAGIGSKFSAVRLGSCPHPAAVVRYDGSGYLIPVFRQLRALPNQLTLLRLSIVPFLVLAILDSHYHRAFILIVVAGVSDGLDGALARIFRQRTELGSYLDPIADKLLLSTLFLVLMHVGLVSRRVTVMVFSRDLGIIVIAALLYATTGTRDFHPSLLGKANTLAQILAVCSVVLAQTDPAPWVLWIRHWSLIATLWLTVLSGFHYLWRSGQRLGAPVEARSGSIL